MSIKNLWSLNIDELLVADKLKDNFKKTNYEVFFPLNSQMKDIDLILLNLKNYYAKSIQVKGSRTYEPTKAEIERYGKGGAAWFRIDKDYIFKPKNRVDYYVFVLHCFSNGEHRKEIKINYLVIPINQFRKICSKKTVRKGGYYHFFIWLDSDDKRAFDFNNKGQDVVFLSKYLNNWKLIK